MFGFMRKRRKMAKFDASALPRPTRITLERAVDEGVLLAEYATRMDAKNDLIIGALRGDDAFDAAHCAEVVRASLAKLADEARDQAERIRAARVTARDTSGMSVGHHDYRRGDLSNLRLREETYSALADRLYELRDDEQHVNSVVDSARMAAWDEVGDVVVSTLAEHNAPIDLGENYEEERLVRMQLLQLEDLADLATERRHSASQ